jgi:hypothetical protein
MSGKLPAPGADGNPRENIDLLARSEKFLVLVMKVGKTHKDTVRGTVAGPGNS